MYSLNWEYSPHLTAPSKLHTSDPSAPPLLDEYGPDKRGHKSRERRCAATGETRSRDEMVRFVLSPSAEVTPDIMAKLPGRGVWVSAQKSAVETAQKNGGFARGFKTKLRMDAGLAELTQQLLARRLLGLLSMAHKSGHIAIGYDQVKAKAGAGQIAWRIEARDGAADGRGKIRTLARAVAFELEIAPPEVMGAFSGAELAQSLGRERAVHIALPHGKLAKAFTAEARRYAGFTDLIPKDWDDYKHEMKTPKSLAHESLSAGFESDNQIEKSGKRP